MRSVSVRAMSQPDTIVSPATPSGESALGVVRVSGPLALELATTFRRGRAPLPWRAWFGDYVEAGGERIDEAIFTYFEGPKSFTGENVLEISSHGNPFITKKIVEDLCSRGARLAEPGEFSKRAFLNGRMDLTSAEAVMDVIRARSDRALDFALRQLGGEMERRMQEVVDRLLAVCAGVEAYIDFPDEDLPGEDKTRRIQKLGTLSSELRRMRGGARCRSVLHDGPSVVLVGEPNAGKSTLFNRLVGSRRAIVSEEPGTTRDFIEHAMHIGPHRIRMIDTAGVRDAPVRIEQTGVELAIEQAEGADLVVLVVDACAEPPSLPSRLLGRLTAGDALVAVNKCDLADPDLKRFSYDGADVVAVSALNGVGIDTLLDQIGEHADQITRTGSHDEGVSVNERHAEALGDAIKCLEEAIRSLSNEDSLELAASELRGAVDAIGRIVGRIDSEEMLDRLFKQFCIGK